MIHILIPFDFSQRALEALEFATKLSFKYDSLQLTLLHVVEYPLNVSVGTLGGGIDPLTDYQHQVYFKELTALRKVELDKLKKHYLSQNFQLNTRIEIGVVFREISQVIEELQPDLIVMGSSGAAGWEEIWIGSTTEKVVRTAPCPVLTIKGATDPRQIKKIIFASNFIGITKEVAARIKSMQHLFDAKFHFVYVNTPGEFKSTREVSTQISNFMEEFHFENLPYEIYNSLTEEAGILEFASDIGADLIAMTTQGRTGFLHLLTGSIAEDVVNHSNRPIWTLKTPEADRK